MSNNDTQAALRDQLLEMCKASDDSDHEVIQSLMEALVMVVLMTAPSAAEAYDTIDAVAVTMREGVRLNTSPDKGQKEQTPAAQRPNRHARRAARAQGKFGGVVCVPRDASPLVKQLVPAILKAAMVGRGKGGDLEHEERAIACFVVACSALASIEDDNLRNETISALAAAAEVNVAQARAGYAEVETMATDAGMSTEQLFKKAVDRGIAEHLPDDPTEH
jgi:hypothetical protein